MPPSRFFNPESTSAYSNASEAYSELFLHTSSNCLVYFDAGDQANVTASFGDNTLSTLFLFEGAQSQEAFDVYFYFKLNVTSPNIASNITVNTSVIRTKNIRIFVRTATGQPVSDQIYSGGSLETTIAIPSPGQYFIGIGSLIGPGSGFITGITNASFTGDIAVCPVSAAYYDAEGNIAFLTCGDLP